MATIDKWEWHILRRTFDYRFSPKWQKQTIRILRMVDAIALSAKVQLLFSVQPTRSTHLCRLPNSNPSANEREVRSPATHATLSHTYTQNTFCDESSIRLHGLINLSDFIVFPGIRFNRIIHSSSSCSAEWCHFGKNTEKIALDEIELDFSLGYGLHDEWVYFLVKMVNN